MEEWFRSEAMRRLLQLNLENIRSDPYSLGHESRPRRGAAATHRIEIENRFGLLTNTKNLYRGLSTRGLTRLVSFVFCFFMRRKQH